MPWCNAAGCELQVHALKPYTIQTKTAPHSLRCREDVHRSNFGLGNSSIPAAQVESAVGRPIHKPGINFYDPFALKKQQQKIFNYQ